MKNFFKTLGIYTVFTPIVTAGIIVGMNAGGCIWDKISDKFDLD